MKGGELAAYHQVSWQKIAITPVILRIGLVQKPLHFQTCAQVRSLQNKLYFEIHFTNRKMPQIVSCLWQTG
jgi:hypothetical protein